jgi:serine/threonine protein kinase/tetratricopeptide (TPR) repeat protein
MYRLGPFELTDSLARGGMGVVWRARHVEQGVPVALKLVETVDDPARAAFRNEVQAVARLHHPGIVMVFDYGEVSDSLVQAGITGPGASYLAMEYASHGSLKGRAGKLGWERIRSTLLALLDALAHAHARGVVHRDLKPGNILLAGPDDLRPGLKIADFGLAWAAHERRASSEVAGTPLYMAPEQLRRRWRDFGPWTDLYALGHIAWELVTGRPALQGRSVPAIVNAQLTGEFPPLEPRMPIPEGFEAWLRRLLVAEPADRYRRCADAAWELAQLGSVDDADFEEPVFQDVLPNLTLTLDDTVLLAALAERPEESATPGPVLPVPPECPPIPDSWSRPTAFEPPFQLYGVGLGLYGLRSVPLVGRVHERDALWSALRDVGVGGEPRFVCLQGASGNGKSRLAGWIAQRAHEVGAAHVIKVVHSPDPTPSDGLGPALARWFGCVGLDRDATRERIAGLVRWDADVEGLAALLRPDDSVGRVQLTGAEERWAVAWQTLDDLSQSRPVLFWIDDAQWGADAIAFCRWVFEQSPSGVCVVATVQEEALAERPVERALLEEVLERPECTRIDVAPLGVDESRALVRVLLGLEGALADRLVERTRGNPLFTIQLVGDWVARGLLVPGERGFELRPGVDLDLPDTLHEVWVERLRRVLDALPQGRDSLEVAAALGQEVGFEEWRAICSHADIPLPVRLVETLTASRLARDTDEGWSFAHGMLRESVIRLARDEGRWAEANLRCVRYLQAAAAPSASRLARHHFAAGDWAAAAEWVSEALQHESERNDLRAMRGLLDLYEQTLRRLSLAESDPRWADLWLARSSLFLDARQPDAALREARRAAGFARRFGVSEVGARAELAIARVATARGEVNTSTTLFDIAVQKIEVSGPERLLPSALIQCAHAHIMAGEIDAATGPLAKARTLLDGDHARLAQVVRFEGDIARLQGRFEAARACFVEATRLNEAAGLRSNASSSLHGVAEMERLLGNLDVAEGIYRQVVEMDRARGQSSDVPRLNLSLCLLARGRFGDAREELEDLLGRWIEQHKPGYAAVAHVTLIWATAGLGDWAAVDRHQSEAQRLCAQTGMVDIDVALCCEAAGALAFAAGHRERAMAAWGLALENWRQLGDQDRVDTLLQRMG